MLKTLLLSYLVFGFHYKGLCQHLACDPLLMSRIYVREHGRRGLVLYPVCVGLRDPVRYGVMFFDPGVG